VHKEIIRHSHLCKGWLLLWLHLVLLIIVFCFENWYSLFLIRLELRDMPIFIDFFGLINLFNMISYLLVLCDLASMFVKHFLEIVLDTLLSCFQLFFIFIIFHFVLSCQYLWLFIFRINLTRNYNNILTIDKSTCSNFF